MNSARQTRDQAMKNKPKAAISGKRKCHQGSEAVDSFQEQPPDPRVELLPNPTDLAMIAAGLSRQSEKSVTELAQLAMELWTQSVHVISEAAERRAERVRARAFANELLIQIPDPEQFPITLDKFLRLMLPTMRGRTGDKFAIYRSFLAGYFTEMVASFGEKLTEGELKSRVEFEFTKQMKEPMNALDYAINAKLFLAWRRTHIAFQRSVSGRKGGERTKQRSSGFRRSVT